MKRKVLILLFLISFLSFWSAKRILAGDLTVICADNGPCGVIPPGEMPLFTEGNWLPGDTVTQRISVENQDVDEDCALILETKNETQTLADFTTKLRTAIYEDTTQIYGEKDISGQATAVKNLSNLFAESPISLGVIPAGQTRNYGWTVSFDFGTGNSYQSAQAKFDFDLSFSCGVLPTPTPTPTSVPTSPPAGGGEAGGGAPVCSDAKPGMPTGFTAVGGPGAGEVSLSWTPPALPYTYFLIAYSDTADWPPKWGNPDVGNVTSFVVSGLGGGTYWFWLRAGNGCMPGDFTGPISPGAIVGIPGALAVAPGFIPGVLGVETPEELGEALVTEEGEVAGVEEKPVCWWWLILSLVEFGVLSIYYWWLSRQKKPRRYWWIAVPVLAVLAYIGDQFIAHKYFIPSRFCSWMWLWSILAAFFPTGLYLYFKRR